MIALTGADDIEEFIRRYGTLKPIDFRLVQLNDDIIAGEFLNQVREFGRVLNADRTNLTTANKKGLDIDASVNAIKSAAETGNQDVNLSGIDEEGDALSGNNQNFQISAPIDTVPATRRDLMRRLFEIYQALTESGAIRAPDLTRAVDRIRQVTRLL